MPLTRLDRLLIDLEYLYAVRVLAWSHDDANRPADVGIFLDVPIVAHAQEITHIDGAGALTAWNSIISAKRLVVAGSIAFDLSKVCMVNVSEDHSAGSIIFRLGDHRGATIPLDKISAGSILNAISAAR